MGRSTLGSEAGERPRKKGMHRQGRKKFTGQRKMGASTRGWSSLRGTRFLEMIILPENGLNKAKWEKRDSGWGEKGKKGRPGLL